MYTGDFTGSEVEQIADNLSLITTKPVIYIINLSKRDFIRKRNKWLGKIQEWVKSHGGGICIPMSIEFEEEVYGLKDFPDQQKALLDECTAEAVALGLTGPQVSGSVSPRASMSNLREHGEPCLNPF